MALPLPAVGAGLATRRPTAALLPTIATGVAFVGLFGSVVTSILHDWWTVDDAQHGLLLFPLALWLAWRTGRAPDARPARTTGTLAIALGVLLHLLATLTAVEAFSRLGLELALLGLLLFHGGPPQLRAWWLPVAVLAVAIPWPHAVLTVVNTPLQRAAAELGAAFLAMRDVPVRIAGNVIQVPGHEFRISEACSGLRSILGILGVATVAGGLLLRFPLSRLLLVIAGVGLVIVLNGGRIFLLGFLILFVNPELAEGVMHQAWGHAVSLVALAALFGIVHLAQRVEALARPARTGAAHA